MATKLSNPEISTITAELNVIQIGNKQMTIAVFNQLYCEDCWIDEQFRILYPIWGKVKRDDEWVIFQKGNDLRKCRIPKKCATVEWGAFLGVHLNTNRDYLNKLIFKGTRPERSNGDLFRLWIHINENRFFPENLTSYIPQDFKSQAEENYREITSLIAAQHKMVDELNNSRQIFIAV